MQAKLITTYNIAAYDAVLKNIYQELALQNTFNMADKIAWISQQFLGKSYFDGALGEGPHGHFDQSPLYRTDLFDCVTLVNTVLAIAISADLTQFQRNILRINYYGGIPKYEGRYHFMSVDWNPQNARLGLVNDISKKIHDEKGKAVFAIADTDIDRPNWFRCRTLEDIKQLKQISAQNAEKLLQELKACASHVIAEKSKLPYLPLDKLFSNDEPDTKLLAQIPHGSIVEIVRPQWNLREKIGTCLNVSHLGFVFKVKNELIFRHASYLDKCVVDVPLITYLRETCLPNSTIKGINIQKVTYPKILGV